VLNENNETVTEPSRISDLKKRLRQRLQQPDSKLPALQQHLPRQMKAFQFKTDVQFWLDEKNNRTAMQIVTIDRPGLLSRIARALMHCSAQLHNAKIATYGERAEDIFYITDSNGQPFDTDSQFDCIKNSIKEYLDD